LHSVNAGKRVLERDHIRDLTAGYFAGAQSTAWVRKLLLEVSQHARCLVGVGAPKVELEYNRRRLDPAAARLRRTHTNH
jgi:hypothetical protein